MLVMARALFLVGLLDYLPVTLITTHPSTSLFIDSLTYQLICLPTFSACESLPYVNPFRVLFPFCVYFSMCIATPSPTPAAFGEISKNHKGGCPNGKPVVHKTLRCIKIFADVSYIQEVHSGSHDPNYRNMKGLKIYGYC